MRTILALTFVCLMGANMSRAEDRFSILQPEQMNAEQKKLLETIAGGARAQNYGSDPVGHVLRRGPFNAWMRSPEFGIRLQAVGEHIRFKSSIPPRLNELAILISARMDLAVRMVCAPCARDEGRA